MNLYHLVKPILFLLDAELAHKLTLRLLNVGNFFGLTKLLFSKQAQNPFEFKGLIFPNRIGLAAGMDKDADYVDALGSLGFGFIEVGTVTPRAQAGNNLPRLFRLPEHNALINRMGFNNKGIEHLLEAVKRSYYNGVLGVNIGKNFDTPNEKAVDDYLKTFERAYLVADYIAINVSSPNTKGLRELQAFTPLRNLLSSLVQKKQDLERDLFREVPVLVKIAPDLDPVQLREIAEIIKELKIDGVIATNTTIDKSLVSEARNAIEEGGLSGAPLTRKSLEFVSELRKLLGKEFLIIGVGGVMKGEDARNMLEAGADLVQIYSGLVYRGPELVRECVQCCSKN